MHNPTEKKEDRHTGGLKKIKIPKKGIYKIWP